MDKDYEAVECELAELKERDPRAYLALLEKVEEALKEIKALTSGV